jgi:hypothetical protein
MCNFELEYQPIGTIYNIQSWFYTLPFSSLKIFLMAFSFGINQYHGFHICKCHWYYGVQIKKSTYGNNWCDIVQ